MSDPHDAYPTKVSRESIFTSYVNNMTTFLMANYPGQSVNKKYENTRANWAKYGPEVVQRFLKQYVKENMQDPKLEIIDHPSYGNAEKKVTTLYTFTKRASTKILTPSGSIYKTTRDHSSFLREQTKDQKATRGREKKLMFEAMAAGNKTKANFHNNNQSIEKIKMNSVIGGMGFESNFMADVAGFNSTTSTSRYLVMSSYAQTERLLEANFFFPNIESVYNFLTIGLQACPEESKVQRVVDGLHLFEPTPDDVLEFLNGNYQLYKPNKLPDNITAILYNLRQYQLTYLYYFSNLKHLIQSNQGWTKAWIADFFNQKHLTDEQLLAEAQPEDLFALDKDLIIMISTAYSYILPLEPSGKQVNIYDTVKAYPDIAKQLAAVGKYITRQMSGAFQEAFELFLDNKTTIPNTTYHKNMYRKTVIGSDTDSVIFTTKNWVKWFTGELRITQEAYRINAITVYWLSKAIAYILRTVCTHRGALDEDVDGIVMKNEFCYPVLVQTSLKKHYVALQTIREGTILPKAKSDIKGLQFRGSNYSSETLTFIKNFIDTTNQKIIDEGTISAKDCINQVIAFEYQIFQSVQRGELTYLNLTSVKNADDYSEEEKTIYFNYLFWEAVFGEKYGNIMIPTKCYLLPLQGVNSPMYMDYLKKVDAGMHQRAVDFLARYPKKKVTRIPINPISDTIPMELMPVVNIRQVIYDNSKALALYMESLGITLGNNNKTRVLMSEVYGLDLKKFADTED